MYYVYVCKNYKFILNVLQSNQMKLKYIIVLLIGLLEAERQVKFSIISGVVFTWYFLYTRNTVAIVPAIKDACAAAR